MSFINDLFEVVIIPFVEFMAIPFGFLAQEIKMGGKE